MSSLNIKYIIEEHFIYKKFNKLSLCIKYMTIKVNLRREEKTDNFISSELHVSYIIYTVSD